MNIFMRSHSVNPTVMWSLDQMCYSRLSRSSQSVSLEKLRYGLAAHQHDQFGAAILSRLVQRSQNHLRPANHFEQCLLHAGRETHRRPAHR